MNILYLDLAKDVCTCNNNCIFCASGPRERNLGTMDTERFKLELRRHSKETEAIFTANGGEPTIRSDVTELLSYANELCYKRIHLESNGRMFFYPEFTKEVVNSGCNAVSIALHAQNAELHDKITMTPGSFKQTVQGIKNLLVYRDKLYIEITILFHKLNYKHLPAIAKFISKEFEGIHNVVLLPVDLAGTSEINKKKLFVRITALKPYLHRGLAVLEKNNMQFSLHHMPFCVIDKQYWKNIAERNVEGGLITCLPPPKSASGCFCTIFESCDKCILKERCPGTWRSYTFRAGVDEFKPIKSV